MAPGEVPIKLAEAVLMKLTMLKWEIVKDRWLFWLQRK